MDNSVACAWLQISNMAMRLGIKFSYFRIMLCFLSWNKRLRVCLDLGKLKGKKRNLESNFLSIVWIEESQKEKNREEKCKENLSCYEENFFLQNMRGK